MNNDKFIDARCVLLCKSFQATTHLYKKLSRSLNQHWTNSLSQYHTFGEYDQIFTFKLMESDKNVLADIDMNNKILTNCVLDSIFVKSLYLLYPSDEQCVQEDIDNFWNNTEPFFFFSTVHMQHCSADLQTIKESREHIISQVDFAKQDQKLDFSFLVYYSLDLSDYMIVWKTKEPTDILCAMQYLYQQSDIVGYTNTIYALPMTYLENLENTKLIVGQKPFSMSIQATTQSYQKTCKIHSDIVKLLEQNNEVSPVSTFSLGSDDYLGFYEKVYPSALYELYDALIKNTEVRDAVISLNTILAINGYSTKPNNDELPKHTDVIETALKMKGSLSNACFELKKECLSLFTANRDVFDKFYWKKTLTELLILLDNMSKSTVFDNACFLLLDSIHLFLMFLKYLRSKFKTDDSLIYALNNYKFQIETFIREWEQLVNHVVQIDGAFQKTPGYEPLNYNISENIIEFYNAFAQKVVSYFFALDEQIHDKRKPQMSSFVVPKLCRKFKTIQWFCYDRDCDGLLFITIPISQIFETYSNMVALTHEVSHYCSNQIRSRKHRKSTFLACVAILICKYIGLYSNNTFKVTYDILKEYFEIEKPDTKDCYLSELVMIAKKIVFRFLDKTENLNRLFVTYKADKKNAGEDECEDATYITELAMRVRRSSIHLMATPSSSDVDSFEDYCSIYDLIDNLLVLFKEGYADIMMIYLLDLKPINYFNESFSDLELSKHKDVFSKYQRVLIVCKALVSAEVWSESEILNCCSPQNKDQNIFIKEFLDVYLSWSNGTIYSQDYCNLFFNKDVLDMIISYLKRCVRRADIKENTQSRALKKEIQELFDSIASKHNNGLFSEEFQNVLQKNRLNIIKKWQNRENDPYTFGEV